MAEDRLIQERNITGIHLTCGFGGNTNLPFVQLLIPRADWMTQMSPAKARELAQRLLEMASIAEAEALLIGYAREIMEEEDMDTLATLLVDFRAYREQQGRYS